MALICLAAGGTGGHLFPASAVAAGLRAQGHEVHLLTDQRGLDYAGDFNQTPRTLISSGALVGKGFFGKMRAVLSLLRGIWQARLRLAQLRPDVLVGFGGYPSFPPLVAAWTLAIPTLLHEQNAVMGLANRQASRFASTIALSFDPTARQTRPAKAIDVGNPVRAEICTIPAFRPPRSTFNILVFGGSLGARLMAEVVPAALAELPAPMRARISLTLQARADDAQTAQDQLAGIGLKGYEIHSFLDPMATYLAQAHLVICRSGATSVAEIASARRPALFIPLNLHADGQQRANAQTLMDIGAARILDQSALTASTLAAQIYTLLHAPEDLKAMAQAAQVAARPNATKDLINLILKTGNQT